MHTSSENVGSNFMAQRSVESLFPIVSGGFFSKLATHQNEKFGRIDFSQQYVSCYNEIA